MVRILKDTILCGVPVHTGDTFPAVDIPESDLNIIIGAGYAERFTPEIKTPETDYSDVVTTDADNIPSEPVKPAKATRKRKK